ncbi:hypothetical protein PFBG_01796 [Plasmodium falciparum 7G8]|uniref:Uncharacterized protein n=2 Tax=Plasmodium falciparum TaxID=5833 RepID=A0A024VAJ5_PLAFA|nr:hypothetical protein PFFVO_01759 [Plasmodium falciparum Vietnam Oak-Knoll (FVO)]EUR73734.1 hypothetical protein PFBG_01796 [Plasmodium falciparum 7G8]
MFKKITYIFYREKNKIRICEFYFVIVSSPKKLYFMNYQIQELFLIIKNELTYILFKSKQMINKEICFFLPHMINTTRSYAGYEKNRQFGLNYMKHKDI